MPDRAVFEGLKGDDVAIQTRDDSNYLIAITPLDNAGETFIYLGQVLRSKNEVLSSLTGIKDATDEISRFNANQSRMNKIFGLTFVETALLILIASIWLGLLLANRLIDPLAGLINAAERVRAGDMSARVKVQGQWGEISDLGSAFNRMTQQLNSQRDALVREHDLSEQRRQFSEAVLSGVRAGVIGLNQNGRITLLNESAKRLLGPRSDALLGQPISEVLAEFAPAFAKAREAITSSAEDQVTLEIDDVMRNFDLRVSAYEGARKDTGWVLTFDDMTRLVSAQRHSAWREVARRIAHEIKNPLTPIQLSAERLQRKYSKEITSDPETFANYTNTIIRQVGSLEQMVNEFSAFARMPAPEFEPLDVSALIANVLFEEGVSFPDIRFTLDGGVPDGLSMRGDMRLLNQALTNIYKNAGEAVLRFQDQSGNSDVQGLIQTDITLSDRYVKIFISDNGPGWPFADTERLLEPYVTTRETGTGLGLAIVKRIAEDHGGSLSLSPRKDGLRGAVVCLSLPIEPPPDILQQDPQTKKEMP
ncbi:PAS domain-containing sensor histidine kinase [Litorimonas sp. RW-G-Af-16]|uniref:sensor histidine kinase n=1 Tax=Litorimonas sp. RW-G-Af-16 TaxID=3241168 RepID=UPI003AAC5374